MVTKLFKSLWDFFNKLQPETRTTLVIIMFGYILYTQITDSTKKFIADKFKEEILHNKKAEQYSRDTSLEINYQIKMIAEKEDDAFDVLLLNYHNNTQSLQGYRYLYLSCLTEVTKSIDIHPLRQYWNKIDYIYYADELSRIHNRGYVQINNIQNMVNYFPKLYRLVKSSDAKAVSFYTIEGKDSAIGLIVILYEETKPKHNFEHLLPYIQRLSLLLDYENNKEE